MMAPRLKVLVAASGPQREKLMTFLSDQTEVRSVGSVYLHIVTIDEGITTTADDATTIKGGNQLV